MAAQSSRGRSNDWSALATANHSLTTDQLQQFNAAGVDPYLVQIAQLIGSQFNISLQGQRNLANAFSSLPRTEFYGQRLGIGFTDRHIARILSESDGGFAFLSILGCLGEYFAEDVVVAVIQALVTSFQSITIPEGYEPSDLQWKRLVHLCQGVLATSPFGTLVTRNHEHPRIATEHVSISQIVTGLVKMSTASRDSTEKTSLEHTGSDAFWFAAVAEYLFDLRVVVRDPTGNLVDAQPGADATNAQVIIGSGQPLFNEDSINQWPLSRAFGSAHQSGTLPNPQHTATPVTGGRVSWEKLFRSCFGQAFTGIEPSLVAEFIGGAASLLSSSLQYDHTKSQELFLPHASTIRGLSGYGLVETVTAWFPEMRRLAPQMGKSARLPFQQARDRLDEISAQLESSCMCSSCGNASATSTEFCKHSLVEVILELGLFIARTVVVPNLFPKRSGILAFYSRLHAGRLLYREREAPGTEAFKEGFMAVLPPLRRLIETMCMLFTGTVPRDIKATTLAISHEGLIVVLNAWNPNSGVRDPDNEQVLIRQRAGVNVSTGSSHLWGRMYSHAYWVPAFQSEEGGAESTALLFSESLELLRTTPKEVRQIVKPTMGELTFSYIRPGKSEEQRATKMGWLVL